MSCTTNGKRRRQYPAIPVIIFVFFLCAQGVSALGPREKMYDMKLEREKAVASYEERRAAQEDAWRQKRIRVEREMGMSYRAFKNRDKLLSAEADWPIAPSAQKTGSAYNGKKRLFFNVGSLVILALLVLTVYKSTKPGIPKSTV